MYWESKYQGSSPAQIDYLHSAAVGLGLNRTDSLKHYWTTFSPFEQRSKLFWCTELRAQPWPAILGAQDSQIFLWRLMSQAMSGFLVSKTLENTAGQTQNLMLLDNKPFQSKLSFKKRVWKLVTIKMAQVTFYAKWIPAVSSCKIKQLCQAPLDSLGLGGLGSKYGYSHSTDSDSQLKAVLLSADAVRVRAGGLAALRPPRFKYQEISELFHFYWRGYVDKRKNKYIYI